MNEADDKSDGEEMDTNRGLIQAKESELKERVITDGEIVNIESERVDYAPVFRPGDRSVNINRPNRTSNEAKRQKRYGNFAAGNDLIGTLSPVGPKSDPQIDVKDSIASAGQIILANKHQPQAKLKLDFTKPKSHLPKTLNAIIPKSLPEQSAISSKRYDQEDANASGQSPQVLSPRLQTQAAAKQPDAKSMTYSRTFQKAQNLYA